MNRHDGWWRDVIWALERAADYILVHGLAKGWFQNEHGSYCALGAINEVTARGYSFISEFAMYTLSQHLLSMGYKSVPEWNDHPDRTKEEVVQALRGAAKKMRDSYKVALDV